ncbi:Vault protein inter-alpha-trypsin [Planctomycetes bacterium Pan216]|uniref:Vault protein inter-alpha-trypsin n=1 Tax=Kolteria novifilia TaxID=2527975 RepID=A0A518AX00_9BACT|nr:Vault protein inter-alpha-trypsin [Planctomycetes bacterium Pan216]
MFSGHCGRAVMLAVLLSGTATTARAEYTEFRGKPISQGRMVVAEADAERIGLTQDPATPSQQRSSDFVLKGTKVDAEISSVLARVRVEQTFQNPFSDRIEAVYVFPLPENAAVDGYFFKVGEKVIRGVVKERQQARKEYEQAKSEGRKASLLEQERANIFTQSLANIPPGAEVTVHIEYVHPVDIDGSSYVFRFPMVVGPRYIPGQPLGRPSVGRGWAPDTDEVPDASRVTPAPLPPGKRSGNDVAIQLTIEGAMPIRDIVPVTHEVDVKKVTPTRSVVRLKEKKVLADKDFVIEYRLAGDQVVVASLAHRSQEKGTFAVVIQPQHGVNAEDATPREYLLLLDRSGSMSGRAISQLRILAQHLLDGLNPQDTFRVATFNNGVRSHRRQPILATPENIADAKAFIRGIRANGGTEINGALHEIVAPREGEVGRPRYLVLVTDALVGNDDSILATLKTPRFADVRVFPVAMGSAPNDYLIRRAAELGRGFSLRTTNEDNPAEIAQRFSRKIAKPVMTDLEIEWGGLAVEEVLPSPLPDLYADRPLVVMGRYAKPGKAEISIKGNLMGEMAATSLSLELPEQEAANDALEPLWARQRIRQIWNRQLGHESADAKKTITRLGIEYQLVTKYTSFIAVERDDEPVLAGQPRQYLVAPMLPEGMTALASGAFATAANANGPARKASPRAPAAGAGSASHVATSQPAPVFSNSSSSGSTSRGGGPIDIVCLGAAGALAFGCSRLRRREEDEEG